MKHNELIRALGLCRANATACRSVPGSNSGEEVVIRTDNELQPPPVAASNKVDRYFWAAPWPAPRTTQASLASAVCAAPSRQGSGSLHVESRSGSALVKHANESGFEVIGDRRGGENGYCDFSTKTIAVRPDVGQAQAVKTLVHELAHALLHGDDSPGRGRSKRSRSDGFTELVKETAQRVINCAKQNLDGWSRQCGNQRCPKTNCSSPCVAGSSRPIQKRPLSMSLAVTARPWARR